MALSRRQILILSGLLLYWPGIFVLTHIPNPQKLIGQIQVSDKTLHFIAYLVLSFLFWFAVNPNTKVNWRKARVWWILMAVVWYGVIDEWLQMYVGRHADVKDFFADLAGALTGLTILTFVNFWPASLVLTAAGIFIMTNFFAGHFNPDTARIDLLFYFCSYTFFSMLWLRYIRHFFPVKAPETKWFIGAIGLPFLLIGVNGLFCIIIGHGFTLSMAVWAIAGTLSVVTLVGIWGWANNRTKTDLAVT